MELKSFLKTRIATGILGLILAFVMVITAKILVQEHQVNSEINKLQAQADKVKKDTTELSALIDYFHTPQYEERQAREKLNLKKDGEFVLSLPQNDTVDAAQVPQKPESNPKQWFNYFFNQ